MQNKKQKKQKTKKTQTFRLNILTHPIIRKLRVKYLNYRQKRNKLVDKSGTYGFIGNFHLVKEKATLATKARLNAG